MLGFILGLLVVILVVYGIIKEHKPHTVLLLGGMVLLFLTYFFNLSDILPAEESTGFGIFDVFEFIRNTFSNTTAGLGLTIMAVGGFAKYMEYTGASNTLVSFAIRPLRNIKRPYLLLPVGFIIGQTLNIFIPSASGLGVLLMVTMYPIFRAVGVSKMSATAVIATTAALDLGPASGNANLAAEISNLHVSEYFVSYQLPISIVTTVVIAALHYIVSIRMDKKENLYLQYDEIETQTEEINTAPALYGLLPLLPLLLILVFSPFMIDTIELDVVTAMLISLFLSMVFETIRYRQISKVFDSIQVFFDGMGSQFAKIVTLVIAGQTFAYGLTQIGFIDYIISGAQNAELGVIPMTIVMVIIIALTAVLMGSGNAPFFAFAALAPDITGPLGIDTVLMALPMQLTSGIARSMSPIAGVLIATAGISGVNPVQVAKRTAIPMLGAIIVMTLMTFILF